MEKVRRREWWSGRGARPRRSLERQAGAEHMFDEWWRWHQVLQLQVKNALHALYGERAQLRQRAQHTAEVRRAAGARIRAARHMRAQTSDDLHLQVLHAMWLLQTVAICDKTKINTYYFVMLVDKYGNVLETRRVQFFIWLF